MYKKLNPSFYIGKSTDSKPTDETVNVGAGVDLKVRVKGLVSDCVCSCALRGWLQSV